MILELHFIFKNLCKLDQNETSYLFIYIKDFVKIIERSIIKKFTWTEMNKLADPYNFIIRIFQNLNNKIFSSQSDIKKIKVNFECFILLINESINIYKNYIDSDVCKKMLLSDIIRKNSELIESKKHYFNKFLEQLNDKDFKYYLIKINKILDKITLNYSDENNTEYISVKGFLKMLKDYGVIPKIISQFKTIKFFFTFSIISNLSHFDIEKNTRENPSFYFFIKELRKFKINRVSLIELLYLISLEFYNNEIIDGELFYCLMCDIFFCNKKSGKSLISSINNKYFQIYSKKNKFK